MQNIFKGGKEARNNLPLSYLNGVQVVAGSNLAATTIDTKIGSQPTCLKPLCPLGQSGQSAVNPWLPDAFV